MPLFTRIVNLAVGWWNSLGSKKNKELPRDQFPPQPPPSTGENNRPSPYAPNIPTK